MNQLSPQDFATLGASHGAASLVSSSTTLQRFEKGAVLSHPAFGGVELSGPILAKWDALHNAADAGGFSVQDVLGAALGGATSFTEAGKPGQAQYFERGMIVVRPDGRSCVVYGEIYGRYRQLGGLTGSLGLPTSDETATANGGRFSSFEGGTLFWSGATGAFAVLHAILARYMAMGGAASFLGLPIADEQPVLVHGQAVGYFSLFANGGIWWTQAHGAWAMPSYVVDYWRQNGGPTGAFGFPTNGLLDIAGTTYMEFEKGVAAFTPTGPLSFFSLDLYLSQFESNFDDIHVQVDIASTAPNQHENFWIPTNGYFSNPNANHHFQVGLVRLDTEITLSTSGYGDHSFGEDERLGTFKGVYNAANLWGTRSTQPVNPANENVNGNFHFNTTLAIKAPAPFDASDVRRSLWWPFHNFDTPVLSQHQMARTFTDVSEDESTFWHPFDAAFYQFVYRTSANGGTCFGMCLEAINARLDRSIFPEPIFNSPFIQYPDGLSKGLALDDPSLTSAQTGRFADPCQIMFGYQLGHPMVDFALGEFLSGRCNDAVLAFHETRDAYARGDYPILSVTSGGLGSPGHAVMPYRWDDTTKPWRIWVANPNAPVADVASNDDARNVCFIDPDKNNFKFVVGLDKSGTPETWQGGRTEPGMIMSVPFHLLSSEPSTPFWEIVAALAAATVVLVIFAGNDGATTQISNGHGATAFHPKTSGAPAGSRHLGAPYNLDAASRLPNFAPVVLFTPPGDGPRSEAYRILHPTPYRRVQDAAPPPDLPAASLAYSHEIAAAGAYQWGLKGPGGSTMVEMVGGASTDMIKIAQIGRADQSVTITSPIAKSAKISVTHGRPDVMGARLFELSSVPVGATNAVTVHLEDTGNQLVVQNTGAEAKIGLRIQSGTKAAQAAGKTATLPAGSVVRFRPDTWAGPAMTTSAVTMEILQHVGGPVLRSLKL